MSKGIYYGGYFGRCISCVPNPFHPYVVEHQSEFYPVDQSTQYSRYLDRVYEAFQRAAKAAYEERGYTDEELIYGVQRKDYEKLQAVADRYYQRATEAMRN